jgi:hypothetical protein
MKRLLFAVAVSLAVTLGVQAQQQGSGFQLLTNGFGGSVTVTSGAPNVIVPATNGLNIVSTTIQCTGGVACVIWRCTTNSTARYILSPTTGILTISEPLRDANVWYGQAQGGNSYVMWAREQLVVPAASYPTNQTKR